MSPSAKSSTAGEALLTAINTKWGSMDNFKVEFAKSATGVFGSGWAWLVKDKENALSIMTTPNQDNPVMDIMPQRLNLSWELMFGNMLIISNTKTNAPIISPISGTLSIGRRLQNGMRKVK